MATKNCPKCETANPVACKKCICGHTFFSRRNLTNEISEEIEAAMATEPEVPRRRTARVTRERPQFYDALQVENQSRRQRELQKKRKASKSDEIESATEEVSAEKLMVTSAPGHKRRADSPPAKTTTEPPLKRRRGRPPGLSNNRKTTRAQILATKESVLKPPEVDPSAQLDGAENVENIHDVSPTKALQMNLVLSDINSRIASSAVRAEIAPIRNVDLDKQIISDETNRTATHLDETVVDKKLPKQHGMKGSVVGEKEIGNQVKKSAVKKTEVDVEVQGEKEEESSDHEITVKIKIENERHGVQDGPEAGKCEKESVQVKEESTEGNEIKTEKTDKDTKKDLSNDGVPSPKEAEKIQEAHLKTPEEPSHDNGLAISASDQVDEGQLQSESEKSASGKKGALKGDDQSGVHGSRSPLEKDKLEDEPEEPSESARCAYPHIS